MELPATKTLEKRPSLLYSKVVRMVRVHATLNPREYREALEAKGDRTWRGVLLDALKVEEDPRPKGRPRRE